MIISFLFSFILETHRDLSDLAVRMSHLSPFSTRRLFSREATFSFVGVAYHISKCDADKGKSRFARKKPPSGKRALRTTTILVYLCRRSAILVLLSINILRVFYEALWTFLDEKVHALSHAWRTCYWICPARFAFDRRNLISPGHHDQHVDNNYLQRWRNVCL